MTRKTLKCQYCNIYGNIDEETMIKHVHTQSSGKTKNKYFHEACYEKYIGGVPTEKEAKESSDRAEQDHLRDVLMEIFDVPPVLIGKYMWVRLSELRHGSIVMGRGRRKRYKKGFSYTLIAETFKYCEKDIRYWIKAKNMTELQSQFNYAFAIVNNKILHVKKLEDKKAHKRAMAEAKKEEAAKQELSGMHIARQVEYKKPVRKHSHDISSFLD